MLYAVEIVIKSLEVAEKDNVINKLEDLGMKITSKIGRVSSSVSKRNRIDFEVKGKWILDKISQLILKHWSIVKSFPNNKVVSKWKGRGIYIENDPDIFIKYN